MENTLKKTQMNNDEIQKTETKELVNHDAVEIIKAALSSRVKFESALNEFFKEIELKPSHAEVIRALVFYSKGETHIEISFAELAALLYKSNGTSEDIKRVRARTRDTLKSLFRWQQKKSIELLRVAQIGKRVEAEDGKFTYSKTLYEIVLLRKIIEVLHSGNEDFDSVFSVILSSMGTEKSSSSTKKPYHPHHIIKTVKNTILTNFRRIFEQAELAGKHPSDAFMSVLSACSKLLVRLEANWQEKQNREKFLSDFESKVNENL
jgi:hypothetical protein